MYWGNTVKTDWHFSVMAGLNRMVLGDDILSGNSLAIVGLYQAIYGINPMYNRLYVEPHLTAALNGSEVNYNFRGQRLIISLDSGKYAVSNKIFKVIAPCNFGFYANKGELLYFDGSSAKASLQITARQPLTIEIKTWDRHKIKFIETARHGTSKPSACVVHQLQPNTYYSFVVNGSSVKKIRSDLNGDVLLYHRLTGHSDIITLHD